jgi:hypothetical protein
LGELVGGGGIVWFILLFVAGLMLDFQLLFMTQDLYLLLQQRSHDNFK